MEQIDELKITNKDLIFEQKNFSIISVPPVDLSSYDFNDPSYLDSLLSYLNIHPCNDNNFLESVAEYSNIKKHPYCNDMETQIIGFDNKHVYEMSFLRFKEGTDMTNVKKNDIGTLLNIEGYEIYGTCLVYKSYISDVDYSMKLVNISASDIGNLLITRKSPKMITYDLGDWNEQKVSDFEKFRKNFFNENFYIEEDLKFMEYSLKIYYTKSDYGKQVIPEITKNKIESMIIHSTYGNMNDNFSIEEFLKIRHLLSKNIIEIDEEFLEKKKDEYGRPIINTKYRLLNLMFNKYK